MIVPKVRKVIKILCLFVAFGLSVAQVFHAHEDYPRTYLRFEGRLPAEVEAFSSKQPFKL